MHTANAPVTQTQPFSKQVRPVNLASCIVRWITPRLITFSRKRLFLAALARRILAARHSLGGPSSCSSAQA